MILIMDRNRCCLAFSPATTRNNYRVRCIALSMAQQQQRRLSHAMFRVPSVQETTDYWIQHHGATVVRSSCNDDGSYKGAFVTLDTNDDRETISTTCSSFALELTSIKNKHNWELGNCVSCIGVAGEASSNVPLEPNGIPVVSLVSSSGGRLARLCLRTGPSVPLHELRDFYTAILGMKVQSQNNATLCLSYANDGGEVPSTTLVFETSNDELVIPGNCFDHLVVETAADIDSEYEHIRQSNAIIFMKPTVMFATKLMGVRDPAGYKVILAGTAVQE
jgi:catechol 2,3-dioxygenase-like lactoylglutathione lyase family enzyme